MSFPVADWQFWTVTITAVGSVWVLVRPFLRRDATPGPGACASCPKAPGGRCTTHEDRERLVVLGGR